CSLSSQPPRVSRPPGMVPKENWLGLRTVVLGVPSAPSGAAVARVSSPWVKSGTGRGALLTDQSSSSSDPQPRPGQPQPGPAQPAMAVPTGPGSGPATMPPSTGTLGGRVSPTGT